MARTSPAQRISLVVVVLVVAAAGIWYAGRHSDAEAGAAPADVTQQLAELKIAPRTSMSGYSRAKFPHWDNQGHNCNTRELVLERDGKNVKAGPDCNPTSGTWFSAYDGETWTKPGNVDIDHVVPLGQAWASGARGWPQDKREQFANDLTRPQLFAVTDNLNQQKGDKAPDEWKPPLVSYWCAYATDWVTVKHFYGLTITTGEKTALQSMLGRCPA